MSLVAATCPHRLPGLAARGAERASAAGQQHPGKETAPPPGIPATPDALDEVAVEVLVQLSQAGSLEAFDALVERHQTAVFNFLCRFTGNVHDAEDLTQDTFVKAHRALPRFQRARAFLPWLFTIARRTALNHFRDRRPADPLPDPDLLPDPASGAAPDTIAGRQDLSASIWRVARRLKPRQHEALWLHYGENLGIEDVATIMRTSRLNVRVLLHRARRELRRLLRRSAWADELPGAPNSLISTTDS